MKVEVLVSTMYQKDLSIINKMNIKTDALIINQCDVEEQQSIKIDRNEIRLLSYNERGLTKSRNKAINNSIGDVCLIADDDLVYHESYEKTILDAYAKYPNASIIAFDIPSTNDNRPTSSLKEGGVNFLHTLKISSFQITFKRKDILEKSIRFNELFGAGSKYTCGEEHIFLSEALKKGLEIRYVKEEIAVVNHNESTWYNGFDKKLFKTKGAMFYEMRPFLAHLLISQFAIRKWKMYKSDMSFIKAYTCMINGLQEYKRYNK
ncbi:glycosyltransferase [Virgibacillus sp. W0430]|uniref:glycosyltransferase n=1 Tax=Virgibacillus sp. W0430 TaxID=3391580 RepID=UPI003F48AC41